MTVTESMLILFFSLMGLSIVIVKLIKDPGRIFAAPVVSASVATVFFIIAAFRFFSFGTFTAFKESILIDALALFHLFLVNAVFLFSSVYATGYFKQGISEGRITVSYARRYSMLWQTFHAILLLVLMSNNLGLMWVAIEATTLVSAFLIISDSDSLSIEAMWKYLLICSVGIAFAFMGTILTVAAARHMEGVDTVYLFSHLIRHPDLIDPRIMLLAFILIAVGFGTKAGLAPMHTWLPDAHSQAPTPVSATFSSVMLNCALFCIMRYLPVTEAALGNDGQAHSILLFFGIMSLLFATIFIPIQFDMKRFLAYCSVEHIGIIAIGLSLGGLGTYAALLHSANHSFAKMLSFFSAGHIGEIFHTRDMRKIRAAISRAPLWGFAFFCSALVLLGVAPGSIFMSEFLIMKEAFFTGKIALVVVFLLFTFLIFMSALKNIMHASFGKPEPEAVVPGSVRTADVLMVTILILCGIVLGLWIPTPYADFLKDAATIVEKGIRP
jgi:hydrogenase-4 component F